MDKKALFSFVDEQKDNMVSAAFKIFDKPEIGYEEHFASELLENMLEGEGFNVEKGIAGLDTAFRATWSNGEGGINIGILGEYDALKDLGHGCGHHMQTPAAIGAAVAIKKVFEGSDIPFTVTVYGTPAEETTGGKIIMAKEGYFSELDIALSTHAARKEAFVGAKSMALRSFNVTYKGKSAHAAGSPYLGRSAADAMFLSFNGIEFMREHVKDGSRMHYTIKEALGPSNIVPAEAKCAYTLRSYDNKYIDELEERFRKIVQGACLMTETEAEIVQTTDYAARKGNKVLADLAHKNLDELGIACEENFLRDSSGSTDFGNVSVMVPSALVYLGYKNASSHSQDWVDAGKTENAVQCIMDSAKTMAGMMYDLIKNPEIAKEAKKEFDEN